MVTGSGDCPFSTLLSPGLEMVTEELACLNLEAQSPACGSGKNRQNELLHATCSATMATEVFGGANQSLRYTQTDWYGVRLRLDSRRYQSPACGSGKNRQNELLHATPSDTVATEVFGGANTAHPYN